MKFYELPPLEPFKLAQCGECCAVIADDEEGANRRQHAEWHAALVTDSYA